jgi:hypothetical protein
MSRVSASRKALALALCAVTCALVVAALRLVFAAADLHASGEPRAATGAPRDAAVEAASRVRCVRRFGDDVVVLDRAVAWRAGSAVEFAFIVSPQHSASSAAAASPEPIARLDDVFDVRLHSAEGVAAVRLALTRCGWIAEQGAGQEARARMPFSAASLATQSNLLWPMSSTALADAWRTSAAFRQRVAAALRDDAARRAQGEHSRRSVALLYRRQHGMHVFHSVLGPFGLLQIFAVLRAVFDDVLSTKPLLTSQERDAAAAAPFARCDGAAAAANDAAAFDAFLASAGDASGTTPFVLHAPRVISDEIVPGRRNTDAPLARALYESLLGVAAPPFLGSRVVGQDDAATAGFVAADVVAYGGFGFEAGTGRRYDDDDYDADDAASALVRCFAGSLRRAVLRRTAALTPTHSAGQALPLRVFVERRPVCVDDAGAHPRLRGMREPVFRALHGAVVLAAATVAAHERRPLVVHDKWPESGFAASQSAPAARAGAHDDDTWRQLARAANSSVFLVSEGGALVQQLVAAAPATLIVAYEHWSAVPFLRHPAYHTKVAWALGHRVAVVVLHRARNGSVTDAGIADAAKHVTRFVESARNGAAAATPRLVFVGADNALVAGRKLLRVPNGRQEMRWELARDGGRAAVRAQEELLAAALRDANGSWCCRVAMC